MSSALDSDEDPLVGGTWEKQRALFGCAGRLRSASRGTEPAKCHSLPPLQDEDFLASGSDVSSDSEGGEAMDGEMQTPAPHDSDADVEPVLSDTEIDAVRLGRGRGGRSGGCG